MSKIKVAVIGTAGIPANYGGFETLTEHLVKRLNERFDFTVYCSSRNYSVKRKFYSGARLVYIPISANGKSSIVYDVISIFHACSFADVLLVLGVGGSFLFPFMRMFTRKKLIVNIDGLEWKRAKWGPIGKWYLQLQERLAVAFAHAVIADNKSIQEYVASRYRKSSTLIAYGSDHAFKVGINEKYLSTYPFLSKDYAFSVCRIEPENNIHVILEAFEKNANYLLVFVGNWNVSSYGANLKKKYTGIANLILLDAIYDPEYLNVLRGNCRIYVHGHSAGGTNPALVEAMNLGLPVLAFDVDYNRNTTQNKALYFRNADELNNLLIKYSSLPHDLDSIAKEIENVAKQEYSWEQISGRYAASFQRVTTPLEKKLS